MRMRPGEALLRLSDDRDCFFELRVRRHQRGAVGQRPSVVLRVRDLHSLRVQLLDEGDHLFQMIEILPMHDQVHGEGDLVPADRAREFDLVRVRLRAGNPVGGFFARILKADLDVIESRVDQRLQTPAR